MATVVCGSLVSIAPVVSICMAGVRPVHRPELVGASEVLVIAPLDAGSASQVHKGLSINTGSNRSWGALPAAAVHVIVVFGAMGVGVNRAGERGSISSGCTRSPHGSERSRTLGTMKSNVG
jgi:hypothetical protein